MADSSPPPTRVWALPDGRIAVRALSLADVWLLVDDQGRTVVASGVLSDEAVEITLDAGRRVVLRSTLAALAESLTAATADLGPAHPVRARVGDVADCLQVLSTGGPRG